MPAHPFRATSLLPAVALLVLLTGCSRLHSFGGVAAIPAHRVPLELLGRPRSERVELSITRLRQTPPPVYCLGPNDVLGVYVENVLGSPDESPPVHLPGEGIGPPSVGFPIPVREDGTIALPMVDPISVAGLSLTEATEKIRRAYTVDRRILPEGRDRILVSLMRRRQYQVLVVREEVEGSGKRGTGSIVNLPAYQNDVLHALNATGGLPGLDASSEILICRGGFPDAVERDLLLAQLKKEACDACGSGLLLPNDANVIRIPLRYDPEAVPLFTEQDVVLHTGDVVLIVSRDRERFYTAGALRSGEHLLPRDRDLDVLQAIALAGGVEERRHGLTHGPSSHAIVVRKTPDGRQVPIRVDLRKALTDSRQRILIQPEDVIVVE